MLVSLPGALALTRGCAQTALINGMNQNHTRRHTSTADYLSLSHPTGLLPSLYFFFPSSLYFFFPSSLYFFFPSSLYFPLLPLSLPNRHELSLP